MASGGKVGRGSWERGGVGITRIKSQIKKKNKTNCALPITKFKSVVFSGKDKTLNCGGNGGWGGADTTQAL